MTTVAELTLSELREFDGYLALKGRHIHIAEALDGFFAPLACCPDLVMPSEYMPVALSGATEEGDLAFESMEEAERFMTLVHLHWNYVNYQLNEAPHMYLRCSKTTRADTAATIGRTATFVRPHRKTGRNEPCSCGSGR